MGRFVSVELLERFGVHGQIPLHDPQRYLLVTWPCGVLQQDPIMLFCHGCRMANAVVIIDVGHTSFGTQRLDGSYPRGGRATGKINHCPLTELLRRPRHCAPVVAVGSGDKRTFAELRF